MSGQEGHHPYCGGTHFDHGECILDGGVDEPVEATLFIGTFSSRCSACGGNADPDEGFHDMRVMRGEGCGAKFTEVNYTYGRVVLPEGEV